VKANALQFDKDIAALKSLKLSAEETEDAIKRLRDIQDAPYQMDEKPPEKNVDPFTPLTEGFESGQHDLDKSADDTLSKIGDLTKDKTVEMAKAWGQMASDAIGSMKGMVDAFKSGDILGGIQMLLDTILKVVQSLQGMGYISSSVGRSGGSAGGLSAGARNGFGGALARGGPVVPGKTYLVGENGPEFISSKRRGFVSPSGKAAQPQRVVVIPSPYFDVVVDQRAASVAAPMAGQAAVMGVAGSEMRQQRRQRRNLLAA